MRCAFLVPHFGAPLPPYFAFWARSCEANANGFHWYVYSDHVMERTAHNEAVTVVPMTVDEMAAGFDTKLGISIVRDNLRKICDYRLLFYFLRRDHEPLDDHDFIGYTDLDVLYGRIAEFLPADPGAYAVLSADDGLPCGPFTMIDRSCLGRLAAADRIREVFADPDHLDFDESRELLDILVRDRPALCQTSLLQPARAPGFNYRRASAVWQAGRVTVADDRGTRREGAFYHFKRYKRLRSFRVVEEDVSAGIWHLDWRGLRALAPGPPGDGPTPQDGWPLETAGIPAAL